MDYFVYSFQFTAVGMEKKNRPARVYVLYSWAGRFPLYAGAKIATAGERAWKLLPANGQEFLSKFLGEGGGGKRPLGWADIPSRENNETGSRSFDLKADLSYE